MSVFVITVRNNGPEAATNVVVASNLSNDSTGRSIIPQPITLCRERMVAKGYGEERLVNRCTNGTACSEAEHQANRRTEITVLAY